MKEGMLVLSMVIPVCASLAQAGIPASFHCDFNNGIPENIRLIDNDGNEPSSDVAAYGFVIGKPWIDVRSDESHVRCAASTSWYKTAAESDDWMILPKVKVVSSDVSLSWEARAHDNVLSDGYNVFISDSGDEIADFKKNGPLFSCDAEKSEWTCHTVSLADYVGKEVTIAFVNNSRDKALLYIDNIAVEEATAMSLSRFVPSLLTVGETLSLEGTVTNNTETDIKGIGLVFSISGHEYVKNESELTIPAKRSVEVSLTTDFVSNAMESYPYTVEVSSGDYTVSDRGVLLSVRQNVLLEEGTGTWCMWCPRGTVAIENLKAKYPDTFIPVAVHAGDPMVVDGYSIYTTSGYPVCVANRMDRLRGDPRNMEEYYLDAAGRNPIAALVSTGVMDASAKKISMKTEAAFSKDYSDARFALQYIVVENNVHSEDARYNQKNGYSGGSEEMGGFENLPNPVPASQMWYQDVARLKTGDDSGISESIPAYIVAGKLLSYDADFVLGDNIMNLDELKVIAAIIDTKNGEVVNSAYATVTEPSSIPEITTSDDIHIERNGNILHVISDSGVESLSLISMEGTIVCEHRGVDSVDLSRFGHGIFIVRIRTDGGYRHFKIMI